MATNSDFINRSTYNQLDNRKRMCMCRCQNVRYVKKARRRFSRGSTLFNNILTTPEFEGVGYAPTFDRLLVYSQDKIKSENMASLIAWCQDKVICCWCKLREYWTVGDYKKQLEEKERQVEALERKLREAEKKIEEASTSSESKLSLPAFHSQLSPFHSTSVDPTTPQPLIVPDISAPVKSPINTNAVIPVAGSSIPIVSVPVVPTPQFGALPPPPPQAGAFPPPPPQFGALPPPPPPPPAVKTPTSTKLIIKKKQNGNLKPKDPSGLFVTPEALKGIRLRKIDNNQKSSTNTESSTPSGLVTLDQLKTVNLRRTQSARSLNEVNKENVHQILAQEMLNRRALKKTTIKRSPGGTPLGDNKRKRESGVGLTPVMTRALKRKFRLAKRDSPSSDEGGSPNQSSPDVSICNQTINSSAGDLSWSSPTDSPTNFSFCRDVTSPLSERLSLSPNITTSSPNLS